MSQHKPALLVRVRRNMLSLTNGPALASSDTTHQTTTIQHIMQQSIAQHQTTLGTSTVPLHDPHNEASHLLLSSSTEPELTTSTFRQQFADAKLLPQPSAAADSYDKHKEVNRMKRRIAHIRRSYARKHDGQQHIFWGLDKEHRTNTQPNKHTREMR